MNIKPDKDQFDQWLGRTASKTFLSDSHQIFEGGQDQFAKLWELYCLGYEQARRDVDHANDQVTLAMHMVEKPIHIQVDIKPNPSFWSTLFKR